MLIAGSSPRAAGFGSVTTPFGSELIWSSQRSGLKSSGKSDSIPSCSLAPVGLEADVVGGKVVASGAAVVGKSNFVVVCIGAIVVVVVVVVCVLGCGCVGSLTAFGWVWVSVFCV